MMRIATIVALAMFATTTDIPQMDQQALTIADTVPTVGQLDNALGAGSAAPTLQKLEAYATNANMASYDTGVRLHAIHGLVHYCAASPCTDSDEAHAAVVSVLTAESAAHDGSDALLLRAAIESLGDMGDPSDVAAIGAQLSHPSRDIRAAAARALGAIGDCSAVSYLRARAAEETIAQVQLALADALRILSPPKCP